MGFFCFAAHFYYTVSKKLRDTLFPFFLFAEPFNPRLLPMLVRRLFPFLLLPSDTTLFTAFVIELPIEFIEFVKAPVIELGEGRVTFGREGIGT
jgi:hypothetical protein